MKSQSPLNEIYKKGLYGDYENKNEENLIKIQEVSNLSIFQIVKYKNSNVFNIGIRISCNCDSKIDIDI